MAKKPTTQVHQSAFHPNMMMVITFFATFIVSALVVYGAHLVFPTHVVLGTQSMSPHWALIHSIGTLSLLLTLVMPFMTEYEKLKGKILTPIDWMTAYLLFNVLGLWLITRYSDQFGLGVTSWVVIICLAVVLDFLQGMVMMMVGELTKKK